MCLIPVYCLRRGSSFCEKDFHILLYVLMRSNLNKWTILRTAWDYKIIAWNVPRDHKSPVYFTKRERNIRSFSSMKYVRKGNGEI